MLEEAGKRFVDNSKVELVEHNLDEPLAKLGQFDVVASSFAIHHCDDGRKRQLYQEIWNLLEPAGVFCNLEHVASPTERIHLRFLKALDVPPEEEDPSNKSRRRFPARLLLTLAMKMSIATEMARIGLLVGCKPD
jgi:SAM-dependent methyltransferase